MADPVKIHTIKIVLKKEDQMEFKNGIQLILHWFSTNEWDSTFISFFMLKELIWSIHLIRLVTILI